MPQFRVGDRVRCLRSYEGRGDHGVENQIYTVASISREGWYRLNGLDYSVSSARFELVEPLVPVPVPVAEPVQVRRQKVLYIIMLGDVEDPEWDYYYDLTDAEEFAQQCRDDGSFIAFKKVTLNY